MNEKAFDSTPETSPTGRPLLRESAASGPVAPAGEGINAEIMAVIEEAAAAFVGRRVRILSVRLRSESDVGSSYWADQGRSVLQSSHNLVQGGHRRATRTS